MSAKYLLTIPLFMSTTVFADGHDKKIWSGEIDLGLTNLTGNTEEKNFSSEIEIVRENAPWKWVNNANNLYTESQKDRTAEKYDYSSYLSYNFKQKYYAFGRAVYENDNFSGYDYQTNYTLGLGWNIYDKERFKWNAELGAGFRSSIVENTSLGEDQDEAIATVSTTVDWQFNEKYSINQYVSFEVGDKITISYSTTELSVKMMDNLAFKLSYHLKHTSKVPQDTDKTDTKTIASLNYTF